MPWGDAKGMFPVSWGLAFKEGVFGFWPQCHFLGPWLDLKAFIFITIKNSFELPHYLAEVHNVFSHSPFHLPKKDFSGGYFKNKKGTRRCLSNASDAISLATEAPRFHGSRTSPAFFDASFDKMMIIWLSFCLVHSWWRKTRGAEANYNRMLDFQQATKFPTG